jgi:hypothetical protein
MIHLRDPLISQSATLYNSLSAGISPDKYKRVPPFPRPKVDFLSLLHLARGINNLFVRCALAFVRRGAVSAGRRERRKNFIPTPLDRKKLSTFAYRALNNNTRKQFRSNLRAARCGCLKCSGYIWLVWIMLSPSAGVNSKVIH